MATYVLVHGAWHGGWCWRRVADHLRRAGHEVYTPTLTGLGERVHLASADVALDTHIADVLGLIEAEELDRFVLVGHSYGGMVVTGVADAAADAISALVYLDAFVPKNGESMFTFRTLEQVEQMRRDASARGDGWRVAPPTPEHFGVADPGDREWVRRRTVDQPIATYGQPLDLTGALSAISRRVYIFAASYENSRFGRFAERARDDPDWDYHALPSGHDVMVDMPAELSEILLGLA